MQKKFPTIWSRPDISSVCARKHSFYANYFTILFSLGLFLTPSVLTAQCVAGQTGGGVWRDFNNDGVKDATETVGVNGVTVKAYDCNGNVAATTTTDALGQYTFTTLTPSVTNKYRIEFSGLPPQYKPTFNGINGRTDVGLVNNKLGVIFAKNLQTNTATTAWLDVTEAPLCINVGQSSVPTNATRGLGSKVAQSADAAVYDLIGKVGFGDIDISEDESKLYFFTFLINTK